MSRREADTGIVWPTLEIVEAAPLWMIRNWWRDLPKKAVDDVSKELILERIAIIAASNGLVDAGGKLKEEVKL